MVLKNRKGFSLVELLAVISIIGILSGVAMSAYSKYTSKATTKSYDSLAKSAIVAAESYLSANSYKSEISINELYTKSYLSNINDPGDTNKKCTGVVSVTTNAASDNALEKYDYSVTVCCPSNNYIYKDGEIEKDDTNKCTDIVKEYPVIDSNDDGKLPDDSDKGDETTNDNSSGYSNNTTSKLCGDANLDGKITANDATQIQKYASEKITLSKQALKNSDVNADGRVDTLDATEIQKYVSGLTTLNCSETLYGDANLSGTITQMDVETVQKHSSEIIKLTGQGFTNADVNLDGVVNISDATLIQKYLAGQVTLPYVEKNLLYGDADLDGRVTITDITAIQSHVAQFEILKGQAFENADVNLDGVVNVIDATLVQKYLAEYITLPVQNNKYKYGDVNLDGKVTDADVDTIMNYAAEKINLDEIALVNGDLNNDLKVDISDATILQMYLAGSYTLPK